MHKHRKPTNSSAYREDTDLISNNSSIIAYIEDMHMFRTILIVIWKGVKHFCGGVKVNFTPISGHISPGRVVEICFR